MDDTAPDTITFYYEDPREPVEICVSLPGDVTFRELQEAFVKFALRVGYSEKTVSDDLAGYRA